MAKRKITKVKNEQGKVVGKILLSQTKTPIERIFYDYVKKNFTNSDRVFAQYQLTDCKPNYVIDFAIPDYMIAIEIDGHDYHKTKEQRTNDAVRERNLQMRGWFVIRFTGSEVYSNMKKCGDDLNALIKLRHNEMKPKQDANQDRFIKYLLDKIECLEEELLYNKDLVISYQPSNNKVISL